MSWREELIGQNVLVLNAQVVGRVTKVHEPGTFVRAGAPEGTKPVAEHVLELDNGHAFLANDGMRAAFYCISPQELFVFESFQESLRQGLQLGFRVAIAAGMHPEDGITLALAAIAEAQRSLQVETQPEAEDEA